MTVFVAFWMSLAFETPIMVLEKLLLYKQHTIDRKQTETISKQDLILNEAIEESNTDLSSNSISSSSSGGSSQNNNTNDRNAILTKCTNAV